MNPVIKIKQNRQTISGPTRILPYTVEPRLFGVIAGRGPPINVSRDFLFNELK